MDWTKAGKNRLLELNELDEFRRDAYENARIYKEKIKIWHDSKLLPQQYLPGQQVLLFNSCLRLFPGKLKSRWSSPFLIVKVFQHGAVLIRPLAGGKEFLVNGQRLKHYTGPPSQQKSAVIYLEDAPSTSKFLS